MTNILVYNQEIKSFDLNSIILGKSRKKMTVKKLKNAFFKNTELDSGFGFVTGQNNVNFSY